MKKVKNCAWPEVPNHPPKENQPAQKAARPFVCAYGNVVLLV